VRGCDPFLDAGNVAHQIRDRITRPAQMGDESGNDRIASLPLRILSSKTVGFSETVAGCH